MEKVEIELENQRIIFILIETYYILDDLNLFFEQEEYYDEEIIDSEPIKKDGFFEEVLKGMNSNSQD